MRAVAALAVLLSSTAALGKPHPKMPVAAPREADCGAPPTGGARWFYLGAPGDIEAAPAAHRALTAILAAFDELVPRDPSCFHVEILDTGALNDRYAQFGRKHGPRMMPKTAIVGFHNRSLGADATVFVVPQPGQGLDVVIVHEVLHVLSHRYSAEAQQRRLSHMVEGATEYLTRALAEASLGVPQKSFRTGYGRYVAFYDALMKRLGKDGPRELATAYFSGGYATFERYVDDTLGISLREAAHALEKDDLRTALSLLTP